MFRVFKLLLPNAQSAFELKTKNYFEKHATTPISIQADGRRYLRSRLSRRQLQGFVGAAPWI